MPRLDADAEDALVEEAARPEDSGVGAQPRNHAASMPLCIQLQLETLAAAAEWSVSRTFARALLVACVIHHIRLNDALNATMLVDESKPDLIVRAGEGRMTVSRRRESRAGAMRGAFERH